MHKTLHKMLSVVLAVALGIPTMIAATFTFAPRVYAAGTPSELSILIGADATLIEVPDSGEDTTTLVVHSSSGGDRRVTAQADFSALPANATVVSAVLKIVSLDGPSNERTYGAHRVDTITAWNEGTVKWSDLDGHFAATATDTQPVVKDFEGTVSWDVTADVTAFLTGTTNNGWVVKDQIEGGFGPENDIASQTTFASGEYTINQALRPSVLVQYNTPPATPALSRPADNGWSNSTESRKPLFAWQAAVDGQGDPLAYHLQATTKDDLGFANPVISKQENSAGEFFSTLGAVVSYQATSALKEGQSYIWRVRATDDPTAWDNPKHASDWTIPFSFTIDTLTPTAPQMRIRHGVVEVNWTAATDATSGIKDYSVLRAASNTGFEVIKTGETGFRYVESTGLNEGSYFYKVTAFDNAGNSVDSDAALGIQDLRAPRSTLSGPAITNNRTINLTWTADDRPAVGIGVRDVELFVITQGGSWQSAGTFTQSPLSYTAAADGQYGFYIIASDKAGNVEAAPVSAQVTTTIDTVAPIQPIILTVTEGNSEVQLTWQPIGGVDRFEVMYGTAPGVYDFSVSLAGNVTSTKVVGLQNGKTYYFAVTAFDAAGNKTASAERSGTPRSGEEELAIGGGVEGGLVPEVQAAEPSTTVTEATPTVTPTVAGAETAPTNWTRILVTIGIIIIAIGAAIGGYYGYGWWMRGDTVPSTPAAPPQPPKRGRGRPRKDQGEEPPSRW